MKQEYTKKTEVLKQDLPTQPEDVENYIFSETEHKIFAIKAKSQMQSDKGYTITININARTLQKISQYLDNAANKMYILFEIVIVMAAITLIALSFKLSDLVIQFAFLLMVFGIMINLLSMIVERTSSNLFASIKEVEKKKFNRRKFRIKVNIKSAKPS